MILDKFNSNHVPVPHRLAVAIQSGEITRSECRRGGFEAPRCLGALFWGVLGRVPTLLELSWANLETGLWLSLLILFKRRGRGGGGRFAPLSRPDIDLGLSILLRSWEYTTNPPLTEKFTAVVFTEYVR